MPGNPESSVVVANYRRLAPDRLRRAVASRVSIRTRQRVKRLAAVVPVGAVRAGVLGVLDRAVHRGFHEGQARVTVRVDRSPRVAHVRAGLDALSARQYNLERVVAALEAAGIDYFAVRGLRDTGSTLAVDEASAELVCAALSRAGQESAAYWSWIYPTGDARPTVIRQGSKRIGWSADQGYAGVRLFWYQTEPTHQLVLGDQYGCEVEFWRGEGDYLVTDRRNRVTREIGRHSPVVDAPGELFTRLASLSTSVLPSVRTRDVFLAQRPYDVPFPIDVVYTWVDGDDEQWMRKRAATLHEPYHADAANASRYKNSDELKYSLRSLQMYAPWVRHIYVVTDDQAPSWLDHSGPDLTVIDHRDIFTDAEWLPTFNSHAIESQLHHIDGLSEHFLYLNDDMMLGAPVDPAVFFHANGVARHFPSPANVPIDDASDSDVPVSVAAINNRNLIEARFGSRPTQKMKHAPYAMRRSVLAEIESEFGPQHHATASHAVRSRADLSIASSLHHYFAFLTGRSVPSDIRYKYIDLGQSDAARLMGLLLADRNVQALCMNATNDSEDSVSPAVLEEFFEAYFPVPSRFER